MQKSNLNDSYNHLETFLTCMNVDIKNIFYYTKNCLIMTLLNELHTYMYMSRPKSESGKVLNWSSPDQKSDLCRPK